ncbi:MAG: hypothetical protein IPP87_01420 [Ideonella sp.]|nr:hypothetical protein [Ideonella sp.]
MSSSKVLSDGGWKDVAAKNSVKDNGLLKKLAEFNRIGDDKHDEALRALDEALKLATLLKKDKKTAPAAGKYLDELVAAAEVATRELGKAKAAADKATKAKAEVDKKAQAHAAKMGEDDDEEEESSELLTTKLKPLLRQVAKGETMHALLAKSGKRVVVMLSRKPIPPARRKMLSEQLGGGSTKYYPGHCSLEAGATTFVLRAEVAGMSKLVKAALLEQTGLRLNKVKCRGEDGDDDDGDDDDTLGAETSELGEQTEEADPEVAPSEPDASERGNQVEQPDTPGDPPGQMGDESTQSPPADDSKAPSRELPKLIPAPILGKAELAKAPAVWHGTRDILEKNVDALKRAVMSHYGSDHPDLDEIEQGMNKLDGILKNLDTELADSLANAHAAVDDVARRAELKNSKSILTNYIKYVKSEPLIAHIDANPFGVDTQLKKVLVDALTHMAQAMA